MKKLILQMFAGLVLIAGLFSVSLVANAMTPTLSVSASGSSDVVITVYGDSYANVTLYYQSYGSGIQSQYIGSTNSGGYLSTTVNSSTYGISNGSTVYVVVNGQTSSSISWPYSYNNNYNYGYGSLVLSQTSVSVAVGQSQEITISGGNMPYTMYPTGANIFQSVISGNRLQVSGLANGTGSLSVCSSGGAGSGCVVLYVTVNSYNYNNNNYNYGGQISLSPSSLSLNSGSNGSVNIYGGSGYYYISSNSNSNIASAYITGNTVNVNAINYGSSTISICQSNGQCVSLYVTVNYGTGYNNPVQQAITFSQTNPALSVGQSLAVTISGGNSYGYYNGNYTIAYNSNPTGLSALLTGSTLTLQGVANGNASVVICSGQTNCSALNVTVGGTVLGTSTGWISCSGENQFCSFSGTRTIQYGANGVYVYRSFTNGATCSNAVFGDPIPGVVKRCSYSN